MTDEEPFDAAEFVDWMLDVPTAEAVAELRALPYEDFRAAHREWTRTFEAAGGRAFSDPEVRETTLRAVNDSIRHVSIQLNRAKREGGADPDWQRRAERARAVLTERRDALERMIAAAAKAGSDPVAAVAAYEEEVIDLRAQVERLQQANADLEQRAQRGESIAGQAKSQERRITQLQKLLSESGAGQEMDRLRAELKAVQQENTNLRKQNAALDAQVVRPESVQSAAELLALPKEALVEKVRQAQRKTQTMSNKLMKAQKQTTSKKRRGR